MENVMSKIGETAAKTYKYAAKATEKITTQIKLKAQMAENKTEIKEIYENIGKKVYEKYLLKEEIKTDFIDDCSMIDALANEVEEIRMELLNIRNLKQCSNCHYEIGLDYHYCPNCGKEQELTKEQKQNDGPATIETIDNQDAVFTKKKSGEQEENKRQVKNQAKRFENENLISKKREDDN